MKKLLSLSSLLVLMYVFSSFSKQNPNFNHSNYETHPNEIIVAYQNLSYKNITEFDEAVAQIPGVKTFGYCQKMNLYFFTYDEQKYRTEEAAFEAISIYTKKYHPLVKVGTSSEQISKNCSTSK